jgi:hypothetical protein
MGALPSTSLHAMNLELPLRMAGRWLGAFGLALIAQAAWAADPLTDAIQSAYAPYRAALFRTNGSSQPEAAEAITQARRGWQTVQQHAARPPAPYDRDPRVADTVAQVAAVYAKAEQQIQAGQLAPAHETLEQARDLMAELRRRNGVVTFSDHMNDYHAQMEHVLGAGPALLAGPQGPLQLMAEVGKLEWLAARLRGQAPPALAADADFAAHLRALDGSVAALRAAVLAGDLAAAREALGKLKGPYSRLFLRFG